MRSPIALAGLVAVLACGAPRAAEAQATERLALDSGTIVRVWTKGKPAIEGYLLASYFPESDSLRMCAAPKGSRCADSNASEIHRFAVGELGGVAIRGRQTWNFGLAGIYVGMLGGAALVGRPRTEERTGPAMVSGLFAGALLGGLIGKHVDGWIPLFPCPRHGQCAWPPSLSPLYRTGR